MALTNRNYLQANPAIMLIPQSCNLRPASILQMKNFANHKSAAIRGIGMLKNYVVAIDNTSFRAYFSVVLQ
ncbi:MAG: hypothetical protein EOP56_04265 [Sphingobacteriales bacterium]|nr:MAG: hypothetical protein EOP56_04265 [Sphingobacteriales bacterium]